MGNLVLFCLTLVCLRFVHLLNLEAMQQAAGSCRSMCFKNVLDIMEKMCTAILAMYTF